MGVAVGGGILGLGMLSHYLLGRGNYRRRRIKLMAMSAHFSRKPALLTIRRFVERVGTGRAIPFVLNGMNIFPSEPFSLGAPFPCFFPAAPRVVPSSSAPRLDRAPIPKIRPISPFSPFTRFPVSLRRSAVSECRIWQSTEISTIPEAIFTVNSETVVVHALSSKPWSGERARVVGGRHGFWKLPASSATHRRWVFSWEAARVRDPVPLPGVVRRPTIMAYGRRRAEL